MKIIGWFKSLALLVPALSLLAFPSWSAAATMNDYCVVPAFIGENVPANLLLMIDNSSSMYDLSYSDQGNGHCSVTTTRSCPSNACPSGETCVMSRQPYYCYDETYNSTYSYAGYFNSATLYNFDFTNKYFTPVASFPNFAFCNAGQISNQLCVGVDGSNKLNYFTASGNYLNWLTASKFDVEKQILTGGKVVTKLCTSTDQACNTSDDCVVGTCDAVPASFLEAESRGCDGNGFIKAALTTDFTNFTTTDPNTQLGVVFSVHGPYDSANPSAPSRGGQSYIDIYRGTYNYANCQQAMQDWGSSTVSQNTLRDDVAACLNYNSSFNYCSGKQTMSCKLDSDCVITTTVPIAGGCSDNPGTACFADTDCATYTNPGTCSNKPTTTCTANSDCSFAYVAGGCSNKVQSCNVDTDCGQTFHPGVCSNLSTQSCTTSADCNIAAVVGGCDNGNPSACNTDSDCTYAPGAGGCTNTGQTCTSNASCNMSCSNSLSTACQSVANCPSGRCNNAAAGTGSTCSSDANCSSFKAYLTGSCSNVSSSKCTVDGDCPGIGTVTAGHCNNTATSGTGAGCTSNAGCTTYKAYHSGYCSNWTSTACNTATQATDCLVSLGYCNDTSGTRCYSDSNCVGNAFHSGKCDLSGNNAQCTSDAECKDGSHPNGYCKGATAATCSGRGNTSGTCSGETTATCSAPSPYPSTTGTCTNPAPSTATCSSPAPPACSVSNTCTNPPPNVLTGHCSNPTPKPSSSGTCSAYYTNNGSCTSPAPIPASSGTCNGITTSHYSCSNPSPTPAGTIDYSPCVDPSQSAIVKTKVAYQHVIQTCWKYFQSHSTFSNGDYTRETNSCNNVLAGWGVCSATNTLGCAVDADCPTGQGPCVFGPTSIRSGNPAIICGQEYLGQFCTWDAVSKSCTWAPESPTVDAAYAAFCNGQQPTVIDPTDSGSATTNMQSVPPILSGIGVESQLGGPIGTMPVRIYIPNTACTTSADCSKGYACLNSVCTPSGLVQQFGNQIRIGAMNFNFNGSASEAGQAGSGITTPQCCSNNTTKLCTMAADCGGNTCGASYCNNLDGATVTSPIGLGKCATLTSTMCSASNPCASGSCLNGFCGTKHSTACATDFACSSGDTCISNGVGDHTTGVVNGLDSIKANAWTPFAEAFYDAIGYFAPVKVCSNSSSTRCAVDSECGAGNSCVSTGVSRTDLRINSGSNPDYDEKLNPSQYPCQSNYVLLITDGSSTADQNTNVKNTANLYSGYSNTTATTCSYFAGSSYLPTLTWLAQKRNITKDTLTSSATPVVRPDGPRDFITTFVVSTGGSNGQAGECNSTKLLSDAAINGGDGKSNLYQANSPQELAIALQDAFQQISAVSASGTAASILSNSEGTGANILQAIFFPRKKFGSTEATWLGELNNLWYYVDPFITKSSTREDTDTDSALKLTKDWELTFQFDKKNRQAYVMVKMDTNGDGGGDTPPPVGVDPRTVACTAEDGSSAVCLDSTDHINALWKAGKNLYLRDLSNPGDLYGGPRTIYTVSNNARINFSWTSPDNSTLLQTDLQYPSDNAGAVKLMKYVHGFDFPLDSSWRSRTVQIGSIPGPTVSSIPTDPYVTNPQNKGVGVWKLGDIISSTPRVQSTLPLNAYQTVYLDKSYADYVASAAYKSRGMVYVGGNDGMLHAFKLGTLNVTPQGDQKATLTGSGLGNEAWAFIPQNALPYLKYYADPNYSHLYFLDGNTTLTDAAIGRTAGCTGDYWDCSKDVSSWRTVLVGGMGIGGASADASSTCTTGLGGTCVRTPVSGVGNSAYYALDVTSTSNPQFMWEFSDAVLPAADKGLGFSTSGAAIVRVEARNPEPNGPPDGTHTRNGRWFAVFGSGPTGPIDTAGHRFMGTSKQPLKVYVVDLNATPPFQNGVNYWVLTDVYTGTTSATSTVASASHAPILDAFSGSMVKGAFDGDRWNPNSPGYYQDDVVYFGYSQLSSSGSWTDGGVLKLLTYESPDPSTWRLVKVIDGIGPVTTGVGKLQDRRDATGGHKLWLYFGTGRYFYLKDDFDTSPVEKIYGIQDQCYRDGLTRNGVSIIPRDTLDPNCATLDTVGQLNDQTSVSSSNLAANWYAPVGWSIDLDPISTSDPTHILGGERVITDPVALTNGAVFFTTYKPNNDFCQSGGKSLMWAVKFDTGTQAPAAALTGKALIQVSTGEFVNLDLASAFNDKLNRRMSDATSITGKPPGDSPPIVSNAANRPVRRILHIQEH